MADSFLDPRSQASLSALQAKLEQLDGNMVRLEGELAKQSTGGARGKNIISDRSVQYLKQAQESIDQQVVSYERLNQLIAERAQLERAAAQATAATGRAVARGAAVSEGGGAVTAGAVGGAAGAAAANEATALEVMTGRYAAATAGALELGVTERELAVNTQTATMAMVDSSNAMTAHGALSTEFLAALAKGQVGIRDLGTQVLQTIGKFGGWTVAAAGVYGALDAVNKLKEGAVDVNSATQGLTRFIPNLNRGEASQQIVQQARQTVTPVADVGAAAQQFAKIYKNQNDVFTATHVALTATKLDNISLADSYRYLTALTQEWGLSASQLPTVFDQITAAQDRLGGSVSQILPAVARSLSAVKNSGGNLDQLIGLTTLTTVRTGQTGNTVGTGFSRGASNFFTNPADRGTLERYGVNPNQGFTQALIEAITKGTTAGWTGLQKQEVSKAFFGPLRGGQFAGLFNAKPDQLNKYIDETRSGKYPGLADTQLGKVRNEASEQIKLIGVNLQAIGAELGGSGLSTPIGALILVFNQLLQATAGILGAWNSLPGPLKEIASSALLASASLALIRRLGVGDAIAQTTGGGIFGALARGVSPVAARNPNAVVDAQVTKYAEGGLAFAQEDVQRASIANVRAQNAYTAALTKRAAAEGAGEKEEAAAQANLVRAQNAAAAANERLEVAVQTQADMTAQFEGYRASPTRRGGVFRKGNATQAAEEAGFGAYAVGGAAGGEAAGAAAATTAREAEVAAAESMGALTFSMEGIEAGAAAATGALSMLVGALLPLGAIAFGGYLGVKAIVDHTEKRENQNLNNIQKSTTYGGAVDAYNKSLRSGFFNPVGGNFLGSGSFANNSGNAQALKGQLQYLDAIGKTSDASGRNLSQVNLWLEKANASGTSGATHLKDLQHALDILSKNNALKSLDPTTYAIETNSLQAQIAAQAAGTKTDPFKAFRGQTLPNLQALLQGAGDRGQLFGVGNNGAYAAAGIAQATSDLQGNNDKANLSVLVQARASYDRAVQQAVTNLETQAKNATTNQAQGADFGQAVTVINQQQANVRKYFDLKKKEDAGNAKQIADLNAMENSISLEIEKGKQTIVNDQIALAKAMSDLAASQDTSIGPAADLQRAVTTLSGLRSQLALAHTNGADAQTVDQLMTSVNQQVMQVLQDRVNQITQVGQAASQLAQSGVEDPVAQAKIDMQYAASQLSQLQALGITNPTTIDPLLAQIRSDKLKMTEQGASLISAQSALAQSTTANPVTIAQDALRGDQTLLAYMIAHHYGMTQIIQQQAQVGNDMKALTQARGQLEEQTTQFEASTYQITSAQEIQKLTATYNQMKKAHASVTQLQQLYQEIFNLEYNSSGGLNLNTGQLKLPTTYQVASAIRSGHNAAKIKTSAGLLADVKTSVQMNVVVNRDVDLKKFTNAIQSALGSSVQGVAQAAGLI